MTMRRLASALLALLLASCGACGDTSTPIDQVPPDSPGAETAPGWWNGAVVYEVFVRSFRDASGDGTGDLSGLVQKLDYLNDGNAATDDDLGVDAIWLMPVYESPSDHGYDVADLDAVERDYGTGEGFATLVREAHARGIKVVLDFVPNHTSSMHPWFRDSASSAGSAHRDWYVWSSTLPPGWGRPWDSSQAVWFPASTGYYYALFWSGMPDLNWTNPAVASEMSAAARRWLARGADGFRFDAVRYLVENGPDAGQQDQPGTHAALRSLAADLRAARPNLLMVGECWADTATIATYFGSTDVVPEGDELPLLFDFPLAGAIVGALQSRTAWGIASTLDAVTAAYPAGVGDAPFLTNHDMVRLATVLGNDPGLLRMAASILLTLRGTPFIYYGEEIGLQNGPSYADEDKRTPMAWDGSPGAGFTAGTPWHALAPRAPDGNVASQTGDPASLLSRYRRLIRVRQASPAIRLGALVRIAAGDAGVVAWLRTGGSETVLVAHNVGASTATLTLAAPGTAAEGLFVDPGAGIAAAAGGGFDVTLPSLTTGVWRLVP